MLEEFFLQFGSLGIVAFVVYYQMTQTNKVIENNTKALERFIYKNETKSPEENVNQ